jgi:hypothetical protein
MAYFLNNLSVLQQTRLQMSMNKFELKILTGEGFRERVVEVLGV